MQFTSNGAGKLLFDTNGMKGFTGSSPRISSGDSTATIPGLIAAAGDTNTGIGWAGVDQLSLISGGRECIRFTRLNDGIIQAHDAAFGITAFATGGQGSAVQLDDTYNVISTVGTAGDSVKLPPVFVAESIMYIKNDAATNAMDVFPASGDDAGAGTDTAVSVAAGDFAVFMATAANATWTKIMGGTA